MSFPHNLVKLNIGGKRIRALQKSVVKANAHRYQMYLDGGSELDQDYPDFMSFTLKLHNSSIHFLGENHFVKKSKEEKKVVDEIVKKSFLILTEQKLQQDTSLNEKLRNTSKFVIDVSGSSKKDTSILELPDTDKEQAKFKTFELRDSLMNYQVFDLLRGFFSTYCIDIIFRKLFISFIQNRIAENIDPSYNKLHHIESVYDSMKEGNIKDFVFHLLTENRTRMITEYSNVENLVNSCCEIDDDIHFKDFDDQLYKWFYILPASYTDIYCVSLLLQQCDPYAKTEDNRKDIAVMCGSSHATNIQVMLCEYLKNNEKIISKEKKI